MLAFTEKSVGIISERSRESATQQPKNQYLQVKSPVLIEEVDDENVVSVKTPCGSEEQKVTVSSEGECEEELSEMKPASQRPFTKVINYKCQAKISSGEGSSESENPHLTRQLTKTSV
jgi:hypothetical protein